jgi:predicted aconitase
MTLEEALQLSEQFAGQKVRCPTWFCLSPEAAGKFKQTEAFQTVRKAGVQVHTCCPLAALTVRPDAKQVLTHSAKLAYYLNGSEYGTQDDCLKVCGAKH